LDRHLQSCPEAAAEFGTYQKLRNDPRIIPFVGTFLRKSSLDELPQLIDVLAGRMSLVGPRPVTRDEVEKYGPVVHLYFATRPGITGLWQVSGRNNLSFQQRVVIDKKYITHWTFGKDIAIIFRTFRVLMTGDGAC
ncbi:MAG: sugar transferase, partial [Pseudomonadota bacterium]